MIIPHPRLASVRAAWRASLAALILCTAAPAQANSVATGEVLLGCRAYAYDQNANFYSGVCYGTVSSMLDLSFVAPLRPLLKICAPASEPYGQAVRVVTQWVEDHPEMQGEKFIDLTRMAMQAAWPCGR
jgi:hypothetical protein